AEPGEVRRIRGGFPRGPHRAGGTVRAGLGVADDVVVRERQERRGEHIDREDDFEPQSATRRRSLACHPLVIIGATFGDVQTPGRIGTLRVLRPAVQHGARRHTIYFRHMFPISDVIPSRTTPYVTIGIIAINALAFLYELTLGSRDLRAFTYALGVVP